MDRNYFVNIASDRSEEFTYAGDRIEKNLSEFKLSLNQYAEH